MRNSRILISGAGIAGPTLAWWLRHYGFTPTIVEQAPALRAGGYAIDVREAAIDVVARMGLLDRLKAESVHKGRIMFTDRRNKPLAEFNSGAFQEVAAGRWVEIMRGDIGKLVYDATKDKVEYIFGDSIREIVQKPSGVDVFFENSGSLEFDLVIGADGLHSVVRKLVFGEETAFEKISGYYVAIFSIDNYLQLDTSNSGYIYNAPGKMAAVIHYTTNDYSATVAFFMFKAASRLAFDLQDTTQQQQLVTAAFKDEGWEIPALLQRMPAATDFYFDIVSQIHMDKWSLGRVALVGDAGYCPSLLSGQGTSVALVGAYILAGELQAAGGDFETAFEKYEKEARGFVEKEQRIGISSKLLVPDTPFGIWTRNRLASLLKLLLIMPQWVWEKMARKSGFRLKQYKA